MKRILKKLFFVLVFLSCISCLCRLNYVFGTHETTLSSVPKLSIIMPVYNVAPYLDEALDSAENQTYKNLEIICVNDGSTDNSLEILKSHAKKDSRIKVIDQKNQGVSEARNVGLRAANGKYVYFFDPDDVLAPYIMEKAIENLEKYNADAFEFKHVRFKYNRHIDTSKYSYKERSMEILKCGKNQNPFEIFGLAPRSVCFRVYKKSLLTDNKLEFKKGLRIAEDALFSCLSKACMKKLVRDKNVGYFYRVKRPGSAMTDNFKIISNRLINELIIIKELILNKDRLNFPGKNEYLLGIMLEFVYKDVGKLKNNRNRSFYARRVYKEIWTNFVKKYKVKLNEGNGKMLSDLKCWSQSTGKNRKLRNHSITANKNKKLKVNKY